MPRYIRYIALHARFATYVRMIQVYGECAGRWSPTTPRIKRQLAASPAPPPTPHSPVFRAPHPKLKIVTSAGSMNQPVANSPLPGCPVVVNGRTFCSRSVRSDNMTSVPQASPSLHEYKTIGSWSCAKTVVLRNETGLAAPFQFFYETIISR